MPQGGAASHKLQVASDTSQAIARLKAGLRASSFEYATTLMRPEHRSQLQDQYKRKIEAIVRKSGEHSAEPEEA